MDSFRGLEEYSNTVKMVVSNYAFALDAAAIEKYPRSLLYRLTRVRSNQSTESLTSSASEENEVFLERDPEAFGILVRFIENGVSCLRKLNSKLLERVYLEAAYFGIENIFDYVGYCVTCHEIFLFEDPMNCGHRRSIVDALVSTFFDKSHSSLGLQGYISNQKMLSIGLTSEHTLQLKTWILPFIRDQSHLAYIPNIISNYGHKLHFNLVYQASVTGFSAEHFHYCDRFQPMLILIRSCSGYLFGGYSQASQTVQFSVISDQSSFLFTLVNPFNIPPTILLPKADAVVGPMCDPSDGPVFGSSKDADLRLYSFSNLHGGLSSLGKAKSGYIDTTGKGGYLFAGGIEHSGSIQFENISEILAFRVIWENPVE